MKLILSFFLLSLYLSCGDARRKGSISVSSAKDFLSKIGGASGQTMIFAADMTIDLSSQPESKLIIPSNTQLRGNGKKIYITNGVTQANAGVQLFGIHFKHCWIDGKTDGGDCLQILGSGVYLEGCTLEDGQDELINLAPSASVVASRCKFLNHMIKKNKGEGADKTFEINKRVAHIDVSYSLFQNVSHLCFKAMPGSKVHIHNNIFKQIVNEAAKVGSSGEVYFSYNFYESFPLHHQFVWSDVEEGACIFSKGECLGLSMSCTPIQSEVVDGSGDKENFNGGRCYATKTPKTPVWPTVIPQTYAEVAAQVASAGAPTSTRRYRRRKY